MTIAVVQTNAANTASVLAALRRAGEAPILVSDPDSVQAAERLVLPGVGAFGAARSVLEGAGLIEVLTERVDAGRPTLGICLGMQLLAESSDESPGVPGLGIVSVSVGRFERARTVPQLGWNQVEPTDGGRFIEPGFAYFANSYRMATMPTGWEGAMSEHGEPFVAALERGDVLACQFHPELSGAWGQALLERWLSGGVAKKSPFHHRFGLRRRVIPCLDVKDGRVVKGIQFQGLRDSGDPSERAGLYAAQGADEIVVLDVSATPEGRANAVETVAAVRAQIGIPLTVGGGVRAEADAARLLGAGADKVGINTAAVDDPTLLTRLAERFGCQCVVLAIDAARTDDGWEVVVRSGKVRTGLDAIEWAKKAVECGAGEILLTSWDRDGTRSGYELDLLKAISEAVSVPVIASGGADTPEHMAEALSAGADAVLAASIFHEDEWTVGRVKVALTNLGAEVRP